MFKDNKSNSKVALIAVLILVIVIAVIILSKSFPSSSTTNSQTTTSTTSTATSEEAISISVVLTAQELIDAGMSPTINLWESYDDRSKVGEATNNESVELIGYDPDNNYCKIRQLDQTEGWISCDWIIDFETLEASL